MVMERHLKEEDGRLHHLRMSGSAEDQFEKCKKHWAKCV